MADEGSQFDDTNIPPPLAVQQQEEEQRRQQQQGQGVQEQAKQMAAQEVKKALLARAKQWAAKIAAQIGTWIMSVAIPAIVGFIVAFWPYILAVIVIIGIAIALIGYVFTGRSGSIPGATISLQDPGQAQLINRLLALTGNKDAIAKLLRENSVEMKKAVDEAIANEAKIQTPEAEKLRLEFLNLRSQIDQLLLAGNNIQQANNVVLNINNSLVNIKKIIDNGRQLLVQEILSDAYKNKIKLRSGGVAEKDLKTTANGQQIKRSDGKFVNIDIRILKLMKYLADQGIVFRPSVIVSGHSENVKDTDRISQHWFGRGVDIPEVNGQPVLNHQNDGSETDKLIQAILKAPSELQPSEICGDRKNSNYGKPYKYCAGHQDHIHVGYK